MSNQSNLSTLVDICQQLAASGKSPSVGMIRAKAPFKVSIPQAVEALKYFNSATPVPETKEAAQPELSLEQRVATLEQQVAQLESQLKAVLNR